MSQIGEYLRLLPKRPYKILEIGYRHGGFLKWFKDNFVGSDVYGIDVEDETEIEGITTIKADQNDHHFLSEIGASLGKFDIIIDDASHDSRATENSFNSLWRFVTRGGWYFIEDWGICHSKDHVYLGDMRKFLYRLEENRKILGIKESEIIYRDTWTSIACFRKK